MFHLWLSMTQTLLHTVTSCSNCHTLQIRASVMKARTALIHG